MKFLIILAATVLAAYGLSNQKQWASFKQKHGKIYNSITEENYRFKVFKSNLRTIKEHNDRYQNGEETFYMGVNKFTDQTPVEYRHFLNRQKPVLPKIEKSKRVRANTLSSNQTSIDWVEQGAVLDVRDQGDCGSSWPFGAIGALEGQNAIINNNRVLLSAQQLIDCAVPFGAECRIGGEFANGFLYVMDYGIVAEADYPFVGNQHFCKADINKTVLEAHGYGWAYTEEELENDVANIGPMSSMINADCIQHYQGGIVSNSSCPNTEWDVNFGVLTVGYNTTSDGIDYWLLKNSLGTEWGESGFFRIQRGVNELGIANHNVYPIINK